MKSVLISMALALACTTAGASAAPLRGNNDAYSRQAATNFARCVANISPAASRRLLAMDFRSAEYGQALRKLMRGHSRCIPRHGELRGAGVLLSGALAETFLAQDVEGSLPAALRFDPARPAIVSRSESETAALCIVRTAPAGVARLVGSPIGSEAEKKAAAPVAKLLPSCLASNVSMTLNVPALRALVALAAYRVAVTNGAVRGVTVNGAVN